MAAENYLSLLETFGGVVSYKNGSPKLKIPYFNCSREELQFVLDSLDDSVIMKKFLKATFKRYSAVFEVAERLGYPDEKVEIWRNAYRTLQVWNAQYENGSEISVNGIAFRKN